MFETMITFFANAEIITNVSNSIDMLANMVDGYLSGVNNLRIASIMLMLLAFMMFVFLVIIIYVKSIVSFLKSDNSSSDTSSDEEIFTNEDEEELKRILQEQERENELEKELQKELELSRIKKEEIDQQKESAKRESQNLENEKVVSPLQKQEELSIPEKEALKDQEHSAHRDNVLDFDWKKGQKVEALTSSQSDLPAFGVESLTYTQTHKELSELMGLIIDMIGRGVDDLKIAQTVIFRNQGKSSENDVLQLIESIKQFINLCLENHFERLPNIKDLPLEKEVLLHLALGDPTLALSLLENLMDYNIDMAQKTPSNKDLLFNEISQQSCTFGNIASINDVHLATGAFELALELNPQNVLAWSRLADMYHRSGNNNQAIQAYQKVLDMADEELHPLEVANASKMLSQYLYSQGNSLQAAKLYNNSKQFYDSLGINRRLDKQEIEIIEIIESHQKDELQKTIDKILSTKQSLVYNF